VSKLTRVKNRDGSESPFDEERIVRSIHRASRERGEGDIVVSRELAGVVTLFLERRHWDSIPHVDDIQDMVERVLLETGHMEAARAYIRARQSSSRTVSSPAKARTPTLFPESTLFVVTGSGEGGAMWDASRIVTALTREAGLSAETASAVAGAVEKKILGAGLERISSRLIRSLVDAELFTRGLSERISSQAVVGVPGYDLKKWIEDSALPAEVTRKVAERSLSEFSFQEVFSGEAGRAHAEGRIHIVGADYPMHLHSAFFTLEFVKRFGASPWMGGESEIPEDFGGLREALRRVVSDLSSYVLGAVDVGYVNLMAAPLLGEEDAYDWAGALLGALEIPPSGIPPLGSSAEIVGGVPDFLRFTDAVGPGGIRLGRGYGEFWTDAERFTRALLDSLHHRFEAEGTPSLFFHVDENTFRNPSSLSLVRGLCSEVARGLPLTFVFERKGTELRIHSRFLTRVEDPEFFRHPESGRIPYVQMVVVNAAQAAFRAGRGNRAGFADELEKALKTAFQAHEDKAAFMADLGGELQGPLKRLSLPASDGRPVLDIARGEYLVSVCGFPEAIGFLSGTDLLSEKDALKAASQTASFLTLKTKEEARKRGIRASLVGPTPRAAVRRLHEIDRSTFPGPVSGHAAEGYRTSLLLREEMPHDLLHAVRVIGSLYSLIEPCVTIEGLEEIMEMDPEGIFDLVCEVFERTEMTYLRFSRMGPES